ncbi:hypothetical protein Tco_1551664 [Tanacetum coccineum]
MSSECNNVKLAIQNAKSEFVYAMCSPNLFMFLGTVRFGNDHVAAILDYGDLQWGNILIDLEIAFRRKTCFIRNLDGVNLLKGSRTTNLYTINLYEMASASCYFYKILVMASKFIPSQFRHHK